LGDALSSLFFRVGWGGGDGDTVRDGCSVIVVVVVVDNGV
jgi:hypothetical protein